MSEDPIGLRGGLNLFLYVSNNPIKLNDPSGTQSYGHASDCKKQALERYWEARVKSKDFNACEAQLRADEWVCRTQELYKETEHLTPLENIIEDKLNSTIPTKPEDMDEYFDWNSI